MISKYALSTALMLSLASDLAYAQQANTSPTPPAAADQANANQGPDCGPDAGQNDDMLQCDGGRGGRHHGRHHDMRGEGRGRHGMMIIDANADGFIGPDEAAALAEGMFMRVDRNHDGAIDEAEATQGPGQHGWRAWLGQKQADDITAKLKAAFAERDADKDGKVTKQEFMNFAQGKYAALDTAKDGKVSPWAFRAQPKL